MRKLENIETIQAIKSTILGFWPNRKSDTFPAPLPVSLERKNFFKILQYPYLICVKSDGVRYLMLAMKGVVYLIDRSFSIYIVDVKFSPKIYGNSDYGLLFDGELIDNNFIIHDCICIFGKDITAENFDERYENVVNVVNNFCIGQEKLGQETRTGTGTGRVRELILSTKKFYKFSEIDEVIKLFHNPDHKIDGLIFTPVTLPIGTHTQYTLFKWKVKSQHTFDFKIIEDPFLYTACTIQFKQETKFASVDKNSELGKTFTEILNKRCPNFKSGDIVECEYNEKYDRFDPLKIRTDKSHPNNLYTIEKTLLNIRENITIEEIAERIQKKQAS